jgi:hypothetical protein
MLGKVRSIEALFLLISIPASLDPKMVLKTLQFMPLRQDSLAHNLENDS